MLLVEINILVLLVVTCVVRFLCLAASLGYVCSSTILLYSYLKFMVLGSGGIAHLFDCFPCVFFCVVGLFTVLGLCLERLLY